MEGTTTMTEAKTSTRPKKPKGTDFANIDDYIEALEKYVLEYVLPNADSTGIWAPEFDDPDFENFFYRPRILDYQPFDISKSCPLLFKIISREHRLDLSDLNILQLELEPMLIHAIEHQRKLGEIISERERRIFSQSAQESMETDDEERDLPDVKTEVANDRKHSKLLEQHRKVSLKKNARLLRQKLSLQSLVQDARELKERMTTGIHNQDSSSQQESMSSVLSESQGEESQDSQMSIDSDNDSETVITCELFNHYKNPLPLDLFENGHLPDDDDDDFDFESDFEVSSESSLEDGELDFEDVLSLDEVVENIRSYRLEQEDYTKRVEESVKSKPTKRDSKDQQVSSHIPEKRKSSKKGRKFLDQSFCFPDESYDDSGSDSERYEEREQEMESIIRKLAQPTLLCDPTTVAHRTSRRPIPAQVSAVSSKKVQKTTLQNVMELAEKLRLNRQILEQFILYLDDYPIFNTYSSEQDFRFEIPFDKLIEASIKEPVYDVRYIRKKNIEAERLMTAFKNLQQFNTIHAKNQKELEESTELNQAQMTSLSFFEGHIKTILAEKKDPLPVLPVSSPYSTVELQKRNFLAKKLQKMTQNSLSGCTDIDMEKSERSPGLTLFGHYTKRLVSCVVDNVSELPVDKLEETQEQLKNLLDSISNQPKIPVDVLKVEKIIQQKLEKYHLLKIPQGSDILDRIQRESIQLRKENERIILNLKNIAEREILTLEFQELFKHIYQEILDAVKEMQQLKKTQGGMLHHEWRETFSLLFLKKDPILFQLRALRSH